MTSQILPAFDNKQLFESILYRNQQPSDSQKIDQSDYTLQRAKKIEQTDHIKEQKEYLEIFGDYVNNSLNWKTYSYKKSFTLIEDIALIYYIGTLFIYKGQEKFLKNLTNSFFVQLLIQETRFLRSAESLRDRYKKYLCFLKNEDFVKIMSYLIENDKDFENGIFGTIIFQNIDGKQKMKEISKQQINYQNKNQSVKLIKNEILESSLKANFNERMQFKKIKLNEKFDFNITIRQTNEQFNERIVQQQGKFENLNFKEKVKIFQEMFNIEYDLLIQNLSQVSGDWNELFKSLYDDKNSQKYQWNDEQDQVLKLVKNKNDFKLQQLIKEKGFQAVKKRIKYIQNKLSI